MSEPIIKFRASNGGIERIACTKETGKTVIAIRQNLFRDGTYQQKENKEGERHRWCDSWQEAHAYLIESALDEVAAARRRLELANAYLGNIKGMKLPKEQP